MLLKDHYKPYLDALEKIKPYTYTTLQAQEYLWDTVFYSFERFGKMRFVECGVCKGGSLMLAILADMAYHNSPDAPHGEYWAYDTYSGMTPHTPGVDECPSSSHPPGFYDTWKGLSVSLPEVIHNVDTVCNVGSGAKIEYVVQDLRQPFPPPPVDGIEVLRLDTDYYDSTLMELQILYPLVRSDGGIIIYDDYHSWTGHKKAVDDYHRYHSLPWDIIPLSDNKTACYVKRKG